MGDLCPMKGQLVDLYFLSLDDNVIGQSAATISGAIRSRIRLAAALPATTTSSCMNWKACISSASTPTRIFRPLRSPPAPATISRELPMNPQFWLRYDFASGDNNLNDGERNTFNQLFPFGNYYLGWIDRVGRQNIHDFNAQLNLHPAPGRLSPPSTTASILRTSRTFCTTPQELLPCGTPPAKREAMSATKSTSVSISTSTGTRMSWWATRSCLPATS